MIEPEDTHPAGGPSLSRLLGLAPPTDVHLGTVIEGRYRLDERLGKGGMGVVYRARQLNAHRDVAVKIMGSQRDGDVEARQRRAKRFQREAMTTARLEHPHIVRLYDVGTTANGDVYMAMELIEGRTLRELIATEAPLSPARVRHLGIQLASALRAAHGAGVVHRDLKPDNIMISASEDEPDKLTVLDFGLAQLAASGDEKLTRDGFLLGTPAYAPPEQARGEDVDHRADLYATGAILYEALTARPVFKGRTALDVMHQHTHSPAPRASESVELPRWLDKLVRELLAKDPELRPPSAEVLKQRLEQGEDRVDASRWFAWAGLLGLLALVGVAVPSLFHSEEPVAASDPHLVKGSPPPADKPVAVATEAIVDGGAAPEQGDERDGDASTVTPSPKPPLATFDQGQVDSFRFDSRKLLCEFTLTARVNTRLVILLKDASHADLDSYQESFEAGQSQKVSVTFKRPARADGNLRCELFDQRGNLIAIPRDNSP